MTDTFNPTTAFESTSYPRRIALLLPNAISARNIIDTPVLQALNGYDVEIAFLSNLEFHKNKINALANPGFFWAKLDQPVAEASGRFQLFNRIKHKSLRLLRAEFGNLVYRFNETHRFRAHEQKKTLSREWREREALAGNYVDSALGRPFEKSRLILKFLLRLYYGRFWAVNDDVRRFFDEFKPNLVVLAHSQHNTIAEYVRLARRRGIRTMGIIASWDQPTTKGPLPSSIAGYLVQNQKMADQLARYHRIDPDRIRITGWPQMDGYAKPVAMDRSQWLQRIGLDEGVKYAVFATNTVRLGSHEIDIIRHIVEQLRAGTYGDHCALIVRPHPNEREVMKRFGEFIGQKHVVLDHEDINDLDHLHHLLNFANVTLATGGTFALDSIAHRVPSIGLAFSADGEDIQRVQQHFTTDHYRELVNTGAVAVCKSFKDLDQNLSRFLGDGPADQDSIEQAMEQFLMPFDGRASQRIAYQVCEALP